jgi:hypothetical protein
MRWVRESTPSASPNLQTRAAHAWLTNMPSLRLAARAVAVEGSTDDAARAMRDWVEFELWPIVPRTRNGWAVLTAVGSLRCVDWSWIARALRL